jgi:hypothetical protein
MMTETTQPAQGSGMNHRQTEQIEEFIHNEEVESRNIMLRWFIGISTTVALGWAGWVSLSIMSWQADRETIHRIESSLAEIVSMNRADADMIRRQFIDMDARIDSMPPKDFRDRVDMMQNKLESFDRDLKQNAVEHQQIIGTIGRMQVMQETMVGLLNEIKDNLRNKVQ